MTKTFQYKILFGFSNFGHCNLFDIWDLIIGISISQLNFTKANHLWEYPKPGLPDPDLYS